MLNGEAFGRKQSHTNLGINLALSGWAGESHKISVKIGSVPVVSQPKFEPSISRNRFRVFQLYQLIQ